MITGRTVTACRMGGSAFVHVMTELLALIAALHMQVIKYRTAVGSDVDVIVMVFHGFPDFVADPDELMVA